MSAMTNLQNDKCHFIIHSAGVSAGTIAAGLAQIPGSDSVPISAIQTTMIIALGKEFGITIATSSAMAMITTFLASQVGRALSQVFFGWFPGVGNALNAATAFSITEKIGWHFAEQFSEEAARMRNGVCIILK